jgi:hypothetical protein
MASYYECISTYKQKVGKVIKLASYTTFKVPEINGLNSHCIQEKLKFELTHFP